MKLLTFIVPLLFSINSFAFKLPSDFLFGVSSASAQVEDGLNDSWMQFAKSGQTSAFLNYPSAEDKINFWSNPEEEIALAKELGVQVFRLSVDWSRLVPKKSIKVTNQKALSRYKYILKLIKKNNMKVMLTLFHHSLPLWALEMGGWSNKELVNYFNGFSHEVFNVLDEDVDYWNTFNEPNVFSMFVHVIGNWPTKKSSFLNSLNFPFFKGDFFIALDNMAKSHIDFFNYAHTKNKKVQVGIAHNTANYKQGGILSSIVVDWSWSNMNYYFPDKVKDHLDFMGINYYGAEYLSLTGVNFSPETEYNDAGRAFDPNGFFKIMNIFYNRYKKEIFITENGTADQDDIFRSLYIVEHLKAISEAIKIGIPVKSYIYWTLTDNFEWSDGYCPKFGLVSYDHKNKKRVKRNSYHFYSVLSKYKEISSDLRAFIWSKYTKKIGQKRAMCRAINGKDGLDSPRFIPLKSSDWRYKEN
jgi:beta-glucosidase/6-phospho-beta-glucosidase/beta-galactosidase